ECDARVAVADDGIITAASFELVECAVTACIRARSAETGRIVDVGEVRPGDALDRQQSVGASIHAANDLTGRQMHGNCGVLVGVVCSVEAAAAIDDVVPTPTLKLL